MVSGYVVYQKKVTNDTEIPEAIRTENFVQEKEDTKSTLKNVEDTKSVEKDVEKTDFVQENTDGIHIMADETIMNRDGNEVVGASIRADGTIQLNDGTIVTPVFDLRSTPDSKTTEAISKPIEQIVIDVAGIDFEYDIKQIKVKKGDTVTINFRSKNGFHDWVIDEFDVATERVTEKDGITSVTFVADKVGTFQYYCSVMNHRQMGMIGYLIVEEK